MLDDVFCLFYEKKPNKNVIFLGLKIASLSNL